jgi:hypothetical protein
MNQNYIYLIYNSLFRKSVTKKRLFMNQNYIYLIYNSLFRKSVTKKRLFMNQNYIYLIYNSLFLKSVTKKQLVYGRININMSIYSYFGSKNNVAARKPLYLSNL